MSSVETRHRDQHRGFQDHIEQVRGNLEDRVPNLRTLWCRCRRELEFYLNNFLGKMILLEKLKRSDHNIKNTGAFSFAHQLAFPVGHGPVTWYLGAKHCFLLHTHGKAAFSKARTSVAQ